MPTITVGDIDLFYLDVGRGEPLLLVMGFGGDHLAWGLQVPVFAERYRVISFDNRGVGQSTTPDVPYTTAMMADDAAGILDALGIPAAHVLGVSMGGMIAQELALRHPPRVRTLQLHCTLARPDRYLAALIDAWGAIRPRVSHEEWLRIVGLWLFSPQTYEERPEFIELLLQNALANPYPQSLTGFLRQGEAVRAHDTVSRLGQIRHPTLVSVAQDDILVPPRFAREVAALIPGAELSIVPDAGHGYFWEKADVFNAMCLDFLARVATPAA